MIFPSNRVRIMVATKPVDFRKQHDGLVAYVKSALRRDPFTGTVFVFRAKRSDRLKLIYWDGTGLVMVYKRLEERGFVWPAIRDGAMMLNHAQFEALFAGLFNPAQVQAFVVLQVEKANQVQLVAGNPAKRLGLYTELLAMGEIAEPLLVSDAGVAPDFQLDGDLKGRSSSMRLLVWPAAIFSSVLLSQA